MGKVYRLCGEVTVKDSHRANRVLKSNIEEIKVRMKSFVDDHP
jgi:hypothetical protein